MAAETDSLGLVPYTAALSVKTDTQVYLLPGTNQAVLGTLITGQPVISTAKTTNGWLQVYFAGLCGYIPGDSTGAFVTPKTIEWKKQEWNQKEIKMNVLGDSITFGDKISGQEASYASILGQKCSAAVLNNYGWNGSAIAGLMHTDRFFDRYPLMDKDANLILVFGGTNDYGGTVLAGTPLGQFGDMGQDTFYGGLNLLMCGLKQMYPESEIVFLTPIKRTGYMNKNDQGFQLYDYAKAIEEMGAVYGIPVIDLLKEPELDFSSRAGIYLVDGLHPNETGHAILSTVVYRKLFHD